MTNISVDFNDRELGGTLPALVHNADGELSHGERVMAIDGEGNKCLAIVSVIEDGMLSLAMDWETYTPAGAAEPETTWRDKLARVASRRLVDA